MDSEIKRRMQECAQADVAEWEEVVVNASPLSREQRRFLQDHPPGLIKALWQHFDMTRDRCGCESPTHERPECAVPWIDRMLRDEA
jgi:hypothetical protein